MNILIGTISRLLVLLRMCHKISMNSPIIADLLITLDITIHDVWEILIRQVLILRLYKDGITDLIAFFDPV